MYQNITDMALNAKDKARIQMITRITAMAVIAHALHRDGFAHDAGLDLAAVAFAGLAHSAAAFAPQQGLGGGTKNNAELTVMPGGEHWFHTKEQMQFLDNWIKNRRACNETENKDGLASPAYSSGNRAGSLPCLQQGRAVRIRPGPKASV